MLGGLSKGKGKLACEFWLSTSRDNKVRAAKGLSTRLFHKIIGTILVLGTLNWESGGQTGTFYTFNYEQLKCQN